MATETDDSDPDEAINICPVCQRSFPSVADLRQHWTKSHTAEEINDLITSKSQESLPNTPPEPIRDRHRLQVINDRDRSPSFQQFDIMENAGSGDCLFHALLEFLRRHSTTFRNVPDNDTELRIKAVRHILEPDNFDRFKDNLSANLHNEITGDADYEDMDATWKHSYSIYMSTPGMYGTTSELCDISELFGFSFNTVRRED